MVLGRTLKAEEERKKEGGEEGAGWRGRDRKGGSPFYYSAMGNPEQVIFHFSFFSFFLYYYYYYYYYYCS